MCFCYVYGNFFGFCFIGLDLGNIAVFYHLVKHKFLTFFAGFWVFQRVEIVWAFRDGSKCCGFGKVNVFDMLAEVVKRGTFYAIGALAEVNAVKVHI